MNMLSLDLGTQCGWALYRGKGKPKYGTIDLSKNHNFDGCGIQYLKFKAWLHAQLPLDIIIFEQVLAHDARAVHAAHKYGGWLAVLQAFGDEYNVQYTGEGVSTIKKHWLGVGRTTKKFKADKAAMIKECRKRGFNPKDDNSADALALLDLGRKLYEEFI